MTVKLSKSKFVAGCQRLKRLYSQVHGPELAAEAHAAAEAIIEQGREVGMLARQLFPDGVEGVLPRKKAATFFQLDECISMMIDLEFASQLNRCTGPTVRRRACNRPMPLPSSFRPGASFSRLNLYPLSQAPPESASHLRTRRP